MNRLRLVVAVLLVVVATSGCSRIFGTALAGVWSGTFTSATGGSGILLLDLAVAGTSITGTWESSFPGVIVSGTLTGTTGDKVLLQLVPTALPECPYSVVADKGRTVLTGSYVSACSPLLVGGTFSLKK